MEFDLVSYNFVVMHVDHNTTGKPFPHRERQTETDRKRKGEKIIKKKVKQDEQFKID